MDRYRIDPNQHAFDWKRDLHGYAGAPPHAQWPNNARVAVSLVVNLEEGAEQSMLAGDPRNETIYDQIAEVRGVPNLGMTCNFNYGPRVGYWRIADLIDSYGATCTINACAQAIELTPWIAADCVRRGYEVGSHGYRWEQHGWMTEDVERERIRLAVETIRRVAGVRPLGWHTRGPCSLNTRRLVIEEGGFLYDSDTTEDDLPFLIDLGDREHVVLPYTQDTNDMHLQRVEGFRLGRHFAEYVIEAFDWLYREGATRPKMMTVGIHTRILGRPGRIAALETILKHMTSRQGVWFARRREIAAHWLEHFGKYGR
jgi:peptidoglycan/xylan/chitin deacetylase (PgdA/CDA1 family)